MQLLKEIGLVLGGYATLALAVITFFYMRSTAKMAKVMSDQITAHIKLTDLKLNSSLLDEDRIKRLDGDASRLDRTNIDFMLNLFVRNAGAGSGSIDKPFLIIKLPNTDEILIKPNTKELEVRPPVKDGFMTYSANIEHDLGGTIFLEGGQSIREEIEYDLKTQALPQQQKEAIISSYGSAEYSIKYKDNLDKEYVERINNIYFDDEL